MLAEAGQLIGVLLILAGAVGYLGLYFRRSFKGGGGDCGCNCGIPLKRVRSRDAQSAPAKPAGGSQQFLPAENLADLAARCHQDRKEAEKGQCCESSPDESL